MAINAKELSKMLNLSEAAVSMALNGKPGVSTQTRTKVLDAAHKYGYDFTKIKHTKKKTGTIYVLFYKKHGAVVGNTPFFKILSSSLEENCKEFGYKIIKHHLIEGDEMLDTLNNVIKSDCIGIILLGTEIYKEDLSLFTFIPVPIVLLDSYFHSRKMDCILMNNIEGAYQATRYLIQKRQTQPGYLHSSYLINNFEERADGFYKALRDCGLSASKSIVHKLPPSIEGAHAEMLNIIENGDPLADCYFADNDLIAIGAMNAFKEKGYKIPEDIGIIGFDNIALCTSCEPNLTTINVPVSYMARMAVLRLINSINDDHFHPIKIEVTTNLIKRQSV